MKIQIDLREEANANVNVYGTPDQNAGGGAQQLLPSDEEVEERQRKKQRELDEREAIIKEKEKALKGKKPQVAKDDDADSDAGDDAGDDDEDLDEDEDEDSDDEESTSTAEPNRRVKRK